MLYLLLLLSIVLCVTKSTVYNTYAKSLQPTVSDILRFNAITYGCAAVVTLLFGSVGKISPFTYIVAAIYAITVSLLQTLSVTAMKFGPMSLTSLFIVYGMIIPSLAGPIFWKEQFGIYQVIGFVLILISICMLSLKRKEKLQHSKKWLLLATLCFLLSGMAGVIEKIHQTSSVKAEKGAFILVACIIMFVLSLFGSIIFYKQKFNSKHIKQLVLIGSISGIIMGAYFKVNLTLAGSLDTLIYFPVANGGAILLTIVVSVVAFHEKLSKQQIFGFIIGLLAVIFLSIPV